jgi:hypothetical protein
MRKVRRVMANVAALGLSLADVWVVEVTGDEVVAYKSRREAFAVLSRPGQKVILPVHEMRREIERQVRRKEVGKPEAFRT